MSKISYSKKFRKILSEMKDDPICQALNEIKGKDLNVTANFYGVKIDDDNVITFTPTNVAERILNPVDQPVKWTGNRGAWLRHTRRNRFVFERLGYTPDGDTPYNPNREEIGYIKASEVSRFSDKTWTYVQWDGGSGVYKHERLENVGTGELLTSVYKTSRQDMRTGRAARILLDAAGYKYTDAMIEVFVNRFRGILSVMNDVFSRFEIVEGEELLKWYNQDNYLDRGRGRLGGSCMRAGDRATLKIYWDNPDTVKLLILKDYDHPDKIIGRSLLWQLEDGNQMMDTIYTNNDADVNVYKEFARAKDYIIGEDTRGNQQFFARTKVKRRGYDRYPSIDTMRNWDRTTGQISNREFDGSQNVVWGG